MVQDAEIEGTFLRLQLLPRNRHQDGVHVHGCEFGKNDIRLGSRARRRIAQLASQNEKRLALHYELSCAVFHPDARRLGSVEAKDGS
jgi:hypothetical protein